MQMQLAEEDTPLRRRRERLRRAETLHERDGVDLILEQWARERLFETAQAARAGGTPFVFSVVKPSSLISRAAKENRLSS